MSFEEEKEKLEGKKGCAKSFRRSDRTRGAVFNLFAALLLTKIKDLL